MRSQLVPERPRGWLLVVVGAAWFAVSLWNVPLGALSSMPLGVYLARPRPSARGLFVALARGARWKQAERRRRRRLRSVVVLRQYQFAELRSLEVHVHGRVRSEVEDLEVARRLSLVYDTDAAVAMLSSAASLHEPVSSATPTEAA